jgi:hypothetical protein
LGRPFWARMYKVFARFPGGRYSRPPVFQRQTPRAGAREARLIDSMASPFSQ